MYSGPGGCDAAGEDDLLALARHGGPVRASRCVKYTVLAVLAVTAIGIAVFFALVVLGVQSARDWLGEDNEEE